ncbi:MAG: hypothetical protein ABIW32_03045 [Terrimesophilobacter sp.]
MSAVPVFQRILKWGGILAIAIAVIGGATGFLTAGTPGLVSALIGTAMSVLFMGITAASILVALRVSRDPGAIGVFFGIVMGGWILKFVVFLVIVFALKGQPWLESTVLFLTIVAGVLGSLVIDVVVVAKSRMGHVSDIILPTMPVDED